MMRWLVGWMIGYLVIVTAVIASLLLARGRALEQLSTPKSVAEWQAWREDVQEQQSSLGPVERRVPISSEPPALVLMRDYFGVSTFGAVLFITALYLIVAWLVTGMLTTKS